MFERYQSEQKQRGVSHLASLFIHGIAFYVFVSAPAIQIPRAAENEYTQAIAGKEEKIVWYRLKDLPNVRPPTIRSSNQKALTQQIAKQTVVSTPKNAPPRQQMVWTPAPEIAPTPLLPNLLAVKLPAPGPKPFITPPDIVRTPAPEVNLPEAPEVGARELAQIDLKTQLPRKQFLQPRAPQRSFRQPRIAADAPEMAALDTPPVPVLSSKLPPRAFVAPAAQRRNPAKRVEVAEAPELAPATTPGSGSAMGPSVKLPPRPFSAPPRPGARGSGTDATALLPQPAELQNSADLNLAVVGVNPAENMAMLPALPSPATFSAGPKLNPRGSDAEGNSDGVVIPDLFVKSEQKPKVLDIRGPAYAAPTSRETLRAALAHGEPVITQDAEGSSTPLPPGVRLSSAPDARFLGRDVFTMAIQMPNITSYSGSWLMWYADRNARVTGLAPIAAPYPHHKVDPKYIPAAVEQRIEGTVTLGCVINREGHVVSVEVVRGADPRLTEAARAALAKWEFYPATRLGEPVEVDVLVQVPFRVEPRRTERR
jgi:TonB family protein